MFLESNSHSVGMLAFEQRKGLWALYEAGVTTGKLELPAKRTPDTLIVADELAQGTSTYHTIGALGVMEQIIEFEAHISTPLSPFHYLKPAVTSDPFSPVEAWEGAVRENYFPLAKVDNAIRGPNHWHRVDEAVICGVFLKGQWETRYFPKSNIPEATWKEALQLLGESDK